jgi:hypothetical protein
MEFSDKELKTMLQSLYRFRGEVSGPSQSERNKLDAVEEIIGKIEGKIGVLKSEKTAFDREMEEHLSVIAKGGKKAAALVKDEKQPKAAADKKAAKAPKPVKAVKAKAAPKAAAKPAPKKGALDKPKAGLKTFNKTADSAGKKAGKKTK